MKRVRRDILAFVIVAICAVAMGLWWLLSPGEVAEHEIAKGITYRAFEIPSTGEGSGLVHVVKIDLTTPGLQLFVTPVDPEMRQQGFEYRLQYIKTVARKDNLIAAINGGYFAADTRFVDLPGNRAIGIDTDISDHHLNHLSINSYMLWFEDDLTPHVEVTKPPPVNALQKARFAMSGQMAILIDGKPNPWAQRNVNHRTLVGIDSQKKLLWLMCAERCSIYRCAELLADLGARDAIALDGGGSTTMVVNGKTVTGGWRPVATCLGIRSNP